MTHLDNPRIQRRPMQYGSAADQPVKFAEEVHSNYLQLCSECRGSDSDRPTAVPSSAPVRRASGGMEWDPAMRDLTFENSLLVTQVTSPVQFAVLPDTASLQHILTHSVGPQSGGYVSICLSCLGEMAAPTASAPATAASPAPKSQMPLGPWDTTLCCSCDKQKCTRLKYGPSPD